MIAKLRDIAILLAVLIASVAYAFSTLRTSNYNRRLDDARSVCLREMNNATNEFGYSVCMRYKGFDVSLGQPSVQNPSY
jgi:hypothetical protein